MASSWYRKSEWTRECHLIKHCGVGDRVGRSGNNKPPRGRNNSGGHESGPTAMHVHPFSLSSRAGAHCRSSKKPARFYTRVLAYVTENLSGCHSDNDSSSPVVCVQPSQIRHWREGWLKREDEPRLADVPEQEGSRYRLLLPLGNIVIVYAQDALIFGIRGPPGPASTRTSGAKDIQYFKYQASYIGDLVNYSQSTATTTYFTVRTNPAGAVARETNPL